MNILLIFGFVLGVCLAAPEPNSWPYRDSLHPYYYGYPGQTPYVYKASLEDDEEPVERSRQDSGVSVSSLIHSAAVKQQEQINSYGRPSERPTVIETGSAAPVQDRPGDSSSPSHSKVANAPAPNVIKPGLVNPPAFPPARRPTQAPSKKPVKEDEDEDEDDEDDEESPENEDETENAPEDEEEEENEEEEEEEEEERRRNEPIDVKPTKSKSKSKTETPAKTAPVVVDAPVASSLESIELPVNVSQPQKPVVVDQANEVSPQGVKGSKGKYPEETGSSEETFSSQEQGMEALVPGYVTEQGEVLVPVDTVTGDQPISIVPDPYTPISRGVPLSYYGYNAAAGPVRSIPGRFRQEALRPQQGQGPAEEDEEDYEVDDEENDLDNEEPDNQDEDNDDEEDEEDEADVKVSKKKKPVKAPKPPLGLIPARAPTNEDDELENRFRSSILESFPPSRSPYLHPVTFRYNGGYLTGPFNSPVDSNEVYQYVEPVLNQQRRNQYVDSHVVRRRPAATPNNVFFAYTQGGPQQSPVRRRPVLPSRPLRIPVSAPYPSNHYLYTNNRRQSQRPRPVFNQGFSGGYSGPYTPYMPRPHASEPMFYPRPSTLHNPGEKLKIKSSYELLVEPHTDYVNLRTKKRPSNNKNKKRVNNKKKSSGQVVKRRPVTILARPVPQRVAPASQVPAGQQGQVFYRPLYNVRPLERVPASGQGFQYQQGIRQQGPGPQSQGFRQPSPYLSNAFQEYREFIKGLAAGYYGRPNGPGPAPGNRRPTPVILQDEPPMDSSSVDSSAVSDSSSNESGPANANAAIAPEERRPKMSPAAKKLNKIKLDTNPDPLNILPRINKKMKAAKKNN